MALPMQGLTLNQQWLDTLKSNCDSSEFYANHAAPRHVLQGLDSVRPEEGVLLQPAPCRQSDNQSHGIMTDGGHNAADCDQKQPESRDPRSHNKRNTQLPQLDGLYQKSAKATASLMQWQLQNMSLQNPEPMPSEAS